MPQTISATGTHCNVRFFLELVRISVLRRRTANFVLKKAKFAGLDPDAVGIKPGATSENFNAL